MLKPYKYLFFSGMFTTYQVVQDFPTIHRSVATPTYGAPSTVCLGAVPVALLSVPGDVRSLSQRDMADQSDLDIS